MRQNIFAFTEPTGPLPGYVSVNTEGDKVELSVRGPAGTSQMGYIVMTDELALKFSNAVRDYLQSKKDKS